MEKVDEQSSFQSTKILDDIDETHEEYSNPFKCLISKEQGNTMQYFCNDVYNSIFKFNKITESEKNELSVLLNDYCNDKVFISFINKLFNEHNSAYDFKSIIQMSAKFPKISTTSAQSVLNDVFKATQSLNIKHYILFLTISIEKLYKEASEKFSKLNLYNGLFYQYFMQYINIYVKENIIANSINIHNKFCLLSFICQHDEDKSSIPGKNKYFNIAIDYSKCNCFKDVWKQIVNNYDALSPSKTQGFNLNGSFVNSVKIFTYIAPMWDNLSATFALRNKTLPLVQNGMSGGNSVSDSDVVKIFAGDYTLVPTNQPFAKSVNVDVISNFDTFNQLSNNRKLQTSHFLITNRKRFNDILSEATQIVVNGLKFKLDDSNIVAAFENSQYAPIHAKNIGFNDKNDMLNDSLTFIKKLKSSFDATDVKTYDQAINFIVHSYIPLLNQFENRCIHKYGAFESKSILSKYATDKVLNVIGISSLIDASFNTSLMGGKSQSPKIIEKRIEVPVIKEVIKEVPVAKENDIINDISYDQIEGGTSSEDLIKALIEGQKQFNKSYEVIYRKLISALNSVTISDVQSHTFSKLYSLCNQFNSIAIKSNKTTSYISGYYGAKNYNRLYTLCVENAIKAITDANVPSFNNALEILKELKQLLKDTADNVQQLRVKFISAPKNISEMLIVASRDVKQPCTLTQKDFNALNDAIARIYNTIRTYSSESNIYNTKQQLENYISKVEDRSKIINEHYDQLITGIKTIFVTVIGGSKEVTYAKEAWISIFNQRRDCMLYLNKVLDAKLTKERIEELKNVNLSQEQIDNIERAFLAFKNIQITPDFKNEMEKLSKLLNHASIGLLFKVIKKLKKLIIKSQYLNFIAQLYKELHIFNTDFNWSEFIDKITNLIVLSSISIDAQCLFNEERYTMADFLHKVSYEFEKYFISFINPSNEYPNLTNSAYNFMYDYLDYLIGTDTEKTINNNVMISNLHELVFPIDIHKSTFDEVISKLGANQSHYHFLELYLEKIKYPVANIFNDNININVNNGKVDIIKNNNSFDSLLNVLYGNIVSSDVTDFNMIQRMVMILSKLYEKYKEKLSDVDKIQHTPYYIKHLPIYLITLYYGSDNNATSGFFKSINGKIIQTDYYGVSICKGDHELDIAKYAIDSLFANVVAVVDKYWAIKYNGNMSIPLNINMILRGGNKQDGGTIFDSMPLHDQSYSSVIPEAVPFYICAFNICQYYMTTFSDKDISSLEPKLILNINKISILYPIYELFNKYRASIKTFTPTQMKISLSVFNEIWNQTQGNEAAKLSRSIDILFNELNACFIFTDKIQLEIIKTTNSLSKAAIDVINERVNVLVEKMKTTLDDSVIEFKEDPETQAKRLESILNKAFNRIKNEPESQRLAVLKSLLIDDDKDGSLRDFYKFMELVISPMLISAKSYVQIFSLFDSYSFEADIQGNNYTETIDFTKYYVLYKDFVTDVKNVATAYTNVWNIITFIREKIRSELKALLIEHPIVLKYNKMKLNKALDEMHKTGRFIMPDFWIVMDENTYPKTPQESFSIEQYYNMNDNIALMKQIWPTVEAKNVADYYNHCVTEFISDYDHFIHNFLSYPGLSDKTIKIISKAAHDALKINTFSKYENSEIEPNKTNVYRINQSKDEMFNNSRRLANIRITKSNNYLYPPPLPVNTLIPPFNDSNRIEELEIVDDSLSNGHENNVHIDGTGVYIKSQSAIKDNITGCEYTWVDWVIFHLARCDKTNFCIPYKLLQIIQDYPGLNVYIRQPGYERKLNKQLYNRLSNGAYNNIVTQNIIARSSSTTNSDKLEYSSLNTSWIGGLISVTPYLINTLIAYKSLMNQNVSYNGNSVLPSMSNLIDALTIFYDDLSNYAPFIPFMSDSVQNQTSYIKTHTFAELLSFIANNNINNIDSTELIKIEWANRWFFTGIDNISFPDYKNKDRFEWIKSFADDKINNNVFKTEFDTTIQTLGRNVWAGLIAKTSNYNIRFKNIYRELDEIIIKVINIMCECDPDIVQNYINNIIHEYNIHINSGLVGKGLHMSGGNEINKTEIYDIPKELEDFVNRLTKGFIIEPMSITQNKTSKIITRDYSNIKAKEPFTKSYIYTSHPHVPKDVKNIIDKITRSEVASKEELSKMNKTFEEIIHSKGASVVYDSFIPIYEKYMINEVKKIQNSFPQLSDDMAQIQREIYKCERIYKQNLKTLNNILNKGFESDLVITLLSNTKKFIRNNNDTKDSKKINEKAVGISKFLEDIVYRVNMRYLNLDIYFTDLYNLYNNSIDSIETNKSYMLKYIAYIYILFLCTMKCLRIYFNSIIDALKKYIEQDHYIIIIYLQNLFNNFSNKVIHLYEDFNDVKTFIRDTINFLSLPIFRETSKDIYLIILYYTNINDYNNNPSLLQISNNKELALSVFYLSIVQGYMTFSTKIDDGLFNIEYLNNNIKETMKLIRTNQNKLPFECMIYNYLDTIIYNMNFFDYNSIENNFSMTGGKYSLDKIKTILTLANTYAKCDYNRAIYIDVSQNVNTFPLIMDKDGNLAPKETYLYKYLYNPNLCSLFNKTQFNNIQYVVSNISRHRLFIIDTNVYEAINHSDLIDLNKVNKKISPLYETIITNSEYSDGILKDMPQFYTTFIHSQNIFNPNDLNKYDGYMKNLFFNIGNKFTADRNGNIEFLDINRTIEPYSKDQLVGITDDILKSAFAEISVNKFMPTPMPIKGNSFCKSVIKPKTHTVTIDDNMFIYIPYSKALSQHLFSPRKDVYNATLISTDQIASPTILENCDDCLVFSNHIEKLNKLNTYDSYIGNAPTYSKDLSNYKNFEINPIHTFIETLLKENINTVLNSNDAIKFNNFGFDIGSMSLMGRGILGGYDISDSFSDRFVNISDSITGNNELEILSSSYNIDKNNSDEMPKADGKLLYSYIFKSDFNGGYVSDSKKMFTLILNYFHKYNISFNSMFNQLCYPSILFNAAALRLSISRLSNIVKNFSDYVSGNNSYKYAYFDMIKLYISNYMHNNQIVLDVCEDYRYQIKFESSSRNPYMSIKEIANVLKNSPNLPGFDKNSLLWLCNQYSCPSVANNFLIEFVKYITIDTSDTQENNKTKNIQKLFATGIPAIFRHLDSITSFISVLFMLLKQTSYYSHEYDRDMTFFNVSNPEPFSIT